MSTHKSQLCLRIFLVALSGVLPLTVLHAEDPKVTAVLSNSDVAVGEVVQMQIRVTGGSGAGAPGEIAVDGLEIHATGTSRQFEMHNFDVSQSISYNYTILPMKGGTFKIPPQTIKIGGHSYLTPELQLNVAGSSTGGTGQGRAKSGDPGAQSGVGSVALIDLIVPKQSAYVGEMVPVEVRLKFDPRRAQPMDSPEITGQGFTMQKLLQSERPRVETINGRTFEVVTFKTAIAAARPGKFEIGPVQANVAVAVPRRSTRSRSGSPFDAFTLDDPFSDPFFADPFGAMAQQQQKVLIKSEAVPLEIKSLPSNAPPDFAGAVGNFTVNVEANPRKVQVGDPITVTASVVGRGNFDRVTAPALQETRGWHTYPASSKFKQDDDIGISGTKKFETVLSPNEKKEAIPAFGFSYFDPLKEQYVTRQSSLLPIQVEGESLATATPAESPKAAAPASTPRATPVPASPAKPGDILDQLNDRPNVAESFSPFYARRTFWLMQLIPLLALIGVVAWRIRQGHRQNEKLQRTTELKDEALDLMRTLRRDQAEPREYYAKARRAVQIKTALATNSDPAIIDAEAAARTFHMDETSRATVRHLFERNDELRYSGAPNGGESASPEKRQQVLDLIDSLKA